ncbi:uncharacterized protein LOC110067326 [Orbicella faveolata]|uniref:uncharacterized protein LOC110067326 n=1 Tax=Orbicella faveolata TaxID=48498 RepID=UPI0009E65E39|nr:uncharacterized protein LOC110067326 [Orbicella faveolata]
MAIKFLSKQSLETKPSQFYKTMERFTNSGNMLVDDFKLFLHGLPPDCQESTLKDFLEGVCGFPGAVTKLSIPSTKTYAFVTLADVVVANCLLGNTLLYCDDSGHFYHVKACRYVQRQFRRKEVKYDVPPKERIDPKPRAKACCSQV